MLRIYYKKIFLLAVFLLSLYILVKYVEHSRNKIVLQKPTSKQNRAHYDLDIVEIDVDSTPKGIEAGNADEFHHVERVPDYLLQISKCPACFGQDLCPELTEGQYKIDISQSRLVRDKEIVYEGTSREGEQIVVKTLTEAEFSTFDKFICKNASDKENCDVSKAILRTFMMKDRALNVNGMRDAHKILGKPRGSIAMAICATERLIDEVKDLYSEGRAVLYTTLLLHPEALLLKFFTKNKMKWPFPRYLGACGRVVLAKHGVRPLKEFLKEPFEVRAGLAMQILQMIDDFQADPDWFIMFSDFSYENLGVTKDNEVIVMDIEDLAIIDKTSILESEYKGDPDYPPKSIDPCNIECFRKFTLDIFESKDVNSVCAKMPQYGHLMYALACQRILSDLDEHRVDNYFGLKTLGEPKRKSEYPGLLHGIPEKDRDTIAELLQECVQETAAGGRTQASEELHDILNEYVNQDGDDEEEEEEEEDEEEGNEK